MTKEELATLIEADIMALSQRVVTELGARVFRNNVGTGWQGKPIKVTVPTEVLMKPGDILLRGARIVHFGLMKGSGDDIGWRSVRITQEMVGQVIAQFVSLEFKVPGKHPDPDQIQWFNNVREAGGLAAIIRDPDVDTRTAFDRAL